MRDRVTPVSSIYIMVASQESETIESSAVRITRYSDTLLVAEKMRTYTLVFVALATVLLYTEYVNATEICPQENCIFPEKCEESVRDTQVLCKEQGTSCCSVVKMEYRTHCRHHGGACMDQCASTLQRQAVDCPSNQICCVLV